MHSSRATSAFSQTSSAIGRTTSAFRPFVAHELYYGAYRSQRASANLARVDALQFAAVDFDKEDARASGETRAVLARAGTPIGGYDVLVAGQARARDLAVITRNQSEFSRVGGLWLENWEQ